MFGLIGGLVGGALGLFGQRSTNRSNERNTRQTNDLNAELTRETNAQNLAFSEKQNAQQLQLAKHTMHLNTPTGIRQEAEKAGFNPNVFSGSAGALGLGYSPQLSSPNLSAPHMQAAPVMGNEYAQLGVGIADAFSGYEQLRIQRAELDMERQRLEHLQKAVTLGEDVPGIYGARNAGTNKNSRLGVARGRNRDGSNGGDSATIGSTSGVAPDRPIEVSPYMSGAGLTEISNRYTDLVGGPIVVPGDDGEPWGFDEVLTAAVAGGWQVSGRGGEAMTLGNPNRPMISATEAKEFRDKQKREREERKKAKEKPKRIGPYPDLRSKTARRKYMRREAPYIR